MSNSAEYDKLITVEQVTETEQSDGSHADAWATFGTAWAAIEPLSGKELIEAGGVEGVYTHRVRMRPVPGVTRQMRVKFIDYSQSPAATMYFGIISVRNPEFGNRELQLNCEERSYEQ